MAASDRKSPIQAKIDRGETISLTEHWQAVLDILDDIAKRESEFQPDELKQDIAYQNAKQGLREMASAGIKLEDNDKFVPTGLMTVGGAIKNARKKYFKEGVPEVTGKASRLLASEYLHLLENFAAKKVKAKKPNGWLQGGLEKDQLDGSKAGYADAALGAGAVKKSIESYDVAQQNQEVKEAKPVEITVEITPQPMSSPPPSPRSQTPVDYEAKIKAKTEAMHATVIQLDKLREAVNQSLAKYTAITQALNLRSQEVVTQTQWKAAKLLPDISISTAEDSESLHNHAQQFMGSAELKALQDEAGSIDTAVKLQDKIDKTLNATGGIIQEDFVPSYVFYQRVESQLSDDSKRMWSERFKTVSRREYVGSFFNTEVIDRRTLDAILQKELTASIDPINKHLKAISGLSTSNDLTEVQQLRVSQAQEKAREESREQIASTRLTRLGGVGLNKARSELERHMALFKEISIVEFARKYLNDPVNINFVTQVLAALNNFRMAAASSPDTVSQRQSIAATKAVSMLLGGKFDPIKGQLLTRVLVESSIATKEGCDKNFLMQFKETIGQAKAMGCIDDAFKDELLKQLKKAMVREKVVVPKSGIVSSLTDSMHSLFSGSSADSGKTKSHKEHRTSNKSGRKIP